MSSAFRVVAPDPDIATAVRGVGTIVEVQLTSDELANDNVFAIEKRAPGDGPRYQSITLAERLPPEELSTVRSFIVRLLRLLYAERSTHVWFVGGLRVDDETWNEWSLPSPNDYVSLEGFADSMRINGRVSILKLATSELDHYAPLLGQGDIVRGVATRRSSLAETLGRLSMAEPMPTTEGVSALGECSLAPVSALVGAGDLFYEEVHNGTRLRLLSADFDEKTCSAAVEAAKQS